MHLTTCTSSHLALPVSLKKKEKKSVTRMMATKYLSVYVHKCVLHYTKCVGVIVSVFLRL